MGEPALFDLPPAFVKQDTAHGHITLAANPFGQCDGAFVDLGAELHWWAYTPLHLDATGARALGRALIAWADRKDKR
jgi:hypothetical protein